MAIHVNGRDKTTTVLTRRVDKRKTVVAETSPANRVSRCHSEHVSIVVTELVIGINPLRV